MNGLMLFPILFPILGALLTAFPCTERSAARNALVLAVAAVNSAALAGLLLSVGAVVLRELMDDQIHSEEDLLQTYSLPLLAMETDQTEIFMALKQATDEALEELADFDNAFSAVEEGGEDGETQ